MRDDDHDGTEAFEYTPANGEAMNSRARALVSPERLVHEAITSDLSVIAVRLIEAAGRARSGDRKRGYIAYAVALFHENPNFRQNVTRGLSDESDSATDDCTGASYDLLIKCLRTEGGHRLRMVFVDERPQVFPLLENLYRPRRKAEEPSSRTYRSLSGRQTDVLQMIARGMSNKCIARS